MGLAFGLRVLYTIQGSFIVHIFPQGSAGVRPDHTEHRALDRIRLREHFTTVDEPVKGVSCEVWENGGSHANAGRFFKDFCDASYRSERARSSVTQLCSHEFVSPCSLYQELREVHAA